ncbi:hypothetical protein TNIN_164121 [Trichonephila inaurata madagascariensis]|uniref:Uncharacterized protein n=1 Tax=Trichonephila inaurata madagascariensis TaxID=2747483 RepID=A0A8X6XH55_9ARAC|nr:hypothetical protein TNIN_164121 [Trichonephila inaurata madagascariensis]
MGDLDIMQNQALSLIVGSVKGKIIRLPSNQLLFAYFNIPDFQETMPPPLDSLTLLPKGRTYLTKEIRKKELSDTVLEAIALETYNQISTA